MKTLFSLCVALIALVPVSHAQILRPQAVNGAILGGIAGAIIGNNSGSLHHDAWRGAAIGAGTGLILGSLANDTRYSSGYVYRSGAPRNYGYYDSSGYGYRHPRAVVRYSNYPRYYSSYPRYSVGYGVNYSYDDYGYDYGRPDYRGTGVVLGGLAGAIIGNNSRDLHNNAWRGAAWGAGLGYIFGSIAENNARYREGVIERPPVYVQQAAPTTAPAAQPQNVTIINNYYNTPATPMSSANGMFGRN